MQHAAIEHIGDPDLAGLGDEEDAIGARHADVAEPVQRIAGGVAAPGKEVAEDRRAEGSLCRAGVPSGGDVVEQQGEKLFVERDGALAAVAVRDDGALPQAAVTLARVPVTLGEQVEVVRLLRRVFDAHGELGLRPEVGEGKGRERKRCNERKNKREKRLSFHRVPPFAWGAFPSSSSLDEARGGKVPAARVFLRAVTPR